MAVAALLVAALAEAAEIRGTLELLTRSGTRPSRTASPHEARVYYEPLQGDHEVPVGDYLLTTRGKEFQPSLLVVGRGSTVRFPNEDPILHNVFSVSGENRFDLGLYGKGPGESWTFEHAGIVRVFCNVHKGMAASILVLDTPFYTTPGGDGSFRLDGLPSGPGRLLVWHPRADPLSLELEVEEGVLEQELGLRITKPTVPSHLNKHGRPYDRRPSDYR